MEFKEKFTNLSLKIFDFCFYVYKVTNDNSVWYEIIAIKNGKEYYVCKLDYSKTSQGIQTFLLKDIAKTLKQKYASFNFKVLKNGIKVNDKVFRLKYPNFYYDLKITIVEYILNLQKQTLIKLGA